MTRTLALGTCERYMPTEATESNGDAMRSKRTQGLVHSEIRAMTAACNAVGGVNLGQGICDVPTPKVVVDAATEAIVGGRSIYTRFDGIEDLRHALSARFAHYNGMSPDPENEVVVTTGSAGAFACTLAALFDPGDEIILFEPFYGYHLNAARAAEVRVRTVRLESPGFALDVDALRRAITPATRAILVNTPMNPCGKVFTQDELLSIASICHEHDLLCVTDEVYEYLVYDGRQHVSMASLPGMWKRTVTLGSYSKTFSITGWRIGYAVAEPEKARAIGLVHDLNYICAPHPLQAAVAAGIRELPDAFYAEMCAGYQRQRDRFCATLASVGLEPIVPEGAYYVLADVGSLKAATAKDAAMRLLQEAGVAGVPGSAFFDGGGERLVRFCYAKREEALNEAIERLMHWGGAA